MLMARKGVRIGLALACAILSSLLLLAIIPSVAAQAAFTPADEASLHQKVTSLVNALPLTRLAGEGADICVVINTPERPYSYRIFKGGGLVEVSPSPYSTYCANDIFNKGPEDLVIQYVDYDSFLDHLADPSCQNLKESGAGEDFYYLPSEFVQPGGVPVCDALFQERYCGAVRQCLSNNEMRLSGLGCCAERRVFEIPGGIANVAFIIVLAVILAAIFISTLVIVRRRHQDEYADLRPAQRATPELRQYIQRALAMGYEQDQVEEHLLRLGWPKETIDAAFADAIGGWLVKEEPLT